MPILPVYLFQEGDGEKGRQNKNYDLQRCL